MINIIWTNHLRSRARERGIDPVLVDRAIRFPDQVENSRQTSSIKHSKIINGKKITAAIKREGNNWIVTSVWQKSHTGRHPYQKSLLERLVYSFVLWLEKGVRARLKF